MHTKCDTVPYYYSHLTKATLRLTTNLLFFSNRYHLTNYIINKAIDKRHYRCLGTGEAIRQIKNNVFANVKRQELNFCCVPFSLLCNNVKIFAFVVNRRYFSICLLDLFKY